MAKYRKPFYLRNVLWLMGIVIGLPGCISWIPSQSFSFYAANQALINRANQYVRSVYSYDQFTTTGFFDVLWVNDVVADCFNRLHYQRTCKNSSCICQELPGSKGFTFILLNSYEADIFSPYCGWSLFLEHNGMRYEGPEVRGIELPCEYRLFFGDNYNQFKTAYMVTFKNDALMYGSEHDNVKLGFRSALHEMSVLWKDACKMRNKYEDCNRCRS